MRGVGNFSYTVLVSAININLGDKHKHYQMYSVAQIAGERLT